MNLPQGLRVAIRTAEPVSGKSEIQTADQSAAGLPTRESIEILNRM
jgi:hypothetical protein